MEIRHRHRIHINRQEKDSKVLKKFNTFEILSSYWVPSFYLVSLLILFKNKWKFFPDVKYLLLNNFSKNVDRRPSWATFPYFESYSLLKIGQI